MNNKILDKFDIILILSVILLIAIGLVSIYSATYGNKTSYDFYNKQMTFVIFGIFIMLFVSFIPPRYLSGMSILFYAISISLLILVLIFGKTINGNKSWFYIWGLGIQPSEFSKVATIMVIANIFYKKEDLNKVNWKDVSLAIMLVMIPVVLIKLENDTGTALIMLTFIIPILLWAQVSPFFLFTIITPVIAAIIAFINSYVFISYLVLILILLFFLKKNIVLKLLSFSLNIIAGISINYFYSKLLPYQQNRINAVFNPSSDPLGSGYNVIQSKVAIGSGGLFGKGFLQGTQTQLKFIPEQWTDFIFCVIGEEFGFIGSIVVIILFAVIIYRIVNIATLSKNIFLKLTSIGIASLLFFHLFINIGMTIGLTPVIGIPLPFVSYGISSLLSFMFMAGLCLNAYRNRKVFI